MEHKQPLMVMVEVVKLYERCASSSSPRHPTAEELAEVLATAAVARLFSGQASMNAAFTNSRYLHNLLGALWQQKQQQKQQQEEQPQQQQQPQCGFALHVTAQALLQHIQAINHRVLQLLRKDVSAEPFELQALMQSYRFLHTYAHWLPDASGTQSMCEFLGLLLESMVLQMAVSVKHRPVNPVLRSG